MRSTDGRDLNPCEQTHLQNIVSHDMLEKPVTHGDIAFPRSARANIEVCMCMQQVGTIHIGSSDDETLNQHSDPHGEDARDHDAWSKSLRELTSKLADAYNGMKDTALTQYLGHHG